MQLQTIAFIDNHSLKKENSLAQLAYLLAIYSAYTQSLA